MCYMLILQTAADIDFSVYLDSAVLNNGIVLVDLPGMLFPV
jgi:hypothetical protein